MEVCNIVQKAVIKTIPKKKICKKISYVNMQRNRGKQQNGKEKRSLQEN